MLCFLLEVTFSTVKYIFCSERILVKTFWLPGLKRIWKWTFVIRWVTFANSSWLRYGKRIAETKKLSSLIQIIPTVLVPWKGCTISIQKEVLGKLQNSGYSTFIGLMMIKNSKSVNTRERLSVMIRLLQSFYSTLIFFSLYNYAHYGEYNGAHYYWRIWRNFFQETKKSY